MSEHDTLPDLPRRRASGEPTGDAAVDAALAELASVHPDHEPSQQLPVLVAVHEALQHRLSSTEG